MLYIMFLRVLRLCKICLTVFTFRTSSSTVSKSSVEMWLLVFTTIIKSLISHIFVIGVKDSLECMSHITEVLSSSQFCAVSLNSHKKDGVIHLSSLRSVVQNVLLEIGSATSQK